MDDLTRQIQELMKEMQANREKTASPETDERQQSVYLIPWLNQEYQQMQEADDRKKNLASRVLTKKITRLHVIGALPPSAP